MMGEPISCRGRIFHFNWFPAPSIRSVYGLFGCWDLQLDALLMAEETEMFRIYGVPERAEEPGVAGINRREDHVGF